MAKAMPEKVYVKPTNQWGDEADEDDEATDFTAYINPNDCAKLGQKVIIACYKLAGYVVLDNQTTVLEDEPVGEVVG